MFDMNGLEIIEIVLMIRFTADRLPSAVTVVNQNTNRTFIIQYMGANNAHIVGHAEA